MLPNPQETAGFVTFTAEILNGNFIFCAVIILNFGNLLLVLSMFSGSA